MIRPIEIRAERMLMRGTIDVLLMARTGNPDTSSFAPPVTFVERSAGAFDAYYPEPTMRLSVDEAQQLMDELWRCGLRPTEGTGSAGSLAATERHLKDMQSVAFGLLERQGVKR